MRNSFPATALAVIFACLDASCITNPTIETLPVSAEALKELLVGNTIRGKYALDGKTIEFAEYYHSNGKITGRDPYRRYEGEYAFTQPDCLVTDYYSEYSEEDGCNRYRHLSDNRYAVVGPSGARTEVEVIAGDQTAADFDKDRLDSTKVISD